MSAGAPESIFFYTMHRCASTLFADVVLPGVRGRRHVDPAADLYRGARRIDPVFEPRGVVYGPIRLSTHPTFPEYRHLVGPVTEPGFVRDRSAVFMVRDPRDLLVSGYYSFGFSHGLSPDPAVRAEQERWRLRIRRLTVDEYALEFAPAMRGHFETAARLLAECRRGSMLRYEDMIDDWHRFAGDLVRCLDVAPPVLEAVRARTRPRPIEDIREHRRSGRVGSFRDHLCTATIERLDDVLGAVLCRSDGPFACAGVQADRPSAR